MSLLVKFITKLTIVLKLTILMYNYMVDTKL